MFWSCRAGCAVERDRDGWGRSDHAVDVEISGPGVMSVDWISQINDTRDDSFVALLTYGRPTDAQLCKSFSECWFTTVCQYSMRNLTLSTDRLMGISAIASRVQERSGVEYIAGLWKETLHQDLLWKVWDRFQDRPRPYRAPSWSCAACDGTIVLQVRGISTLHVEEMAKITNIEIKLSTENVTGTGLVSDGTLILEGLLKKPFRITINPTYRSQQGCRDVQLRASPENQEEPGIPPHCEHELMLD